MSGTRGKFATQVNTEILAALRTLAEKEARRLQALVDEAFAGLIEEAAALCESLSQNHAFIDGNKRTAFAATYTFLAVNGALLTADSGDACACVAPSRYHVSASA